MPSRAHPAERIERRDLIGFRQRWIIEGVLDKVIKRAAGEGNGRRANSTRSPMRAAAAHDFVGLAKQWALRHTKYRLEAEIAYLTDPLAAVPEIVAAERLSRPGKPKDC